MHFLLIFCILLVVKGEEPCEQEYTNDTFFFQLPYIEDDDEHFIPRVTLEDILCMRIENDKYNRPVMIDHKPTDINCGWDNDIKYKYHVYLLSNCSQDESHKLFEILWVSHSFSQFYHTKMNGANIYLFCPYLVDDHRHKCDAEVFIDVVNAYYGERTSLYSGDFTALFPAYRPGFATLLCTKPPPRNMFVVFVMYIWNLFLYLVAFFL